jgi:hypothetical protein
MLLIVMTPYVAELCEHAHVLFTVDECVAFGWLTNQNIKQF